LPVASTMLLRRCC